MLRISVQARNACPFVVQAFNSMWTSNCQTLLVRQKRQVSTHLEGALQMRLDKILLLCIDCSRSALGWMKTVEEIVLSAKEGSLRVVGAGGANKVEFDDESRKWAE